MSNSYKSTIFAWVYAIFFLIAGLSALYVRFSVAESSKEIVFGIVMWAMFSLVALVIVQFTATHVALGQPIPLSELPRRDFL